MRYHIEEVQIPRAGGDALDLGEGKRIVHVVSQVPAEDAGGLDTLHVLVEDDGTGGDPRGYEGSGPGANMAAPQPAGPVGDEAQQDPEYPDAQNVPAEGNAPERDYPEHPLPGEDAGPAEVQDAGPEAEPAWTAETSEYEPPFERQDPGETSGEDGDQAGPVAESEPVDDGQQAAREDDAGEYSPGTKTRHHRHGRDENDPE